MKKKGGGVAKRTILVTDSKGQFRIELPEGARLTFGPAVPYGRNNSGGIPDGYALRIYLRTKENLIAVFNNVLNFRDVTMPLARLIVREAGKSVWKSDETGYKVETEAKREHGWEELTERQLNAPPDGPPF